MVQLIPTTSVEFETLTAVPVWGEENEVDISPGDKEEWFKTLNFYKIDLRLGNISHRYDDIIYMEDMLDLTHALLNLRGGVFHKQAWLALGKVASTTELSHSRGGFFRKNARTVHTTEESSLYDDTKKSALSKAKKSNGW